MRKYVLHSIVQFSPFHYDLLDVVLLYLVFHSFCVYFFLYRLHLSIITY